MSVQLLPLCANVVRQSRAEAFRIPCFSFVPAVFLARAPWFSFAAFGVGLLSSALLFPTHSVVPALPLLFEHVLPGNH